MMLIRKAAALIWLALPPLALSALIHMADPDVDGWAGLQSPPVLWSAAALGVMILLCFWLCLGSFLRWGRWAFLAVSGLVSTASGLMVTVAGSGATTAGGLAVTFAACTGFVAFMIVVAVVPAAAVGWPEALLSRRVSGHAAS